MSRNRLMVLVLALATLTTACNRDRFDGNGKNAAPPTAEEARVEMLTISADLNDYGTPNDNWTDENLKTYIGKIKRLEELDQIVPGRGSLQDYKLNLVMKHSRALAESILSARNFAANDMDIPMELKDSDRVIEESKNILLDIAAAGRPSVAWSNERLSALNDKINQFNENVRRLDTLPEDDKRGEIVHSAMFLIDLQAKIIGFLEAHQNSKFDISKSI